MDNATTERPVCFCDKCTDPARWYEQHAVSCEDGSTVVLCTSCTASGIEHNLINIRYTSMEEIYTSKYSSSELINLLPG